MNRRVFCTRNWSNIPRTIANDARANRTCSEVKIIKIALRFLFYVENIIMIYVRIFVNCCLPERIFGVLGIIIWVNFNKIVTFYDFGLDDHLGRLYFWSHSIPFNTSSFFSRSMIFYIISKNNKSAPPASCCRSLLPAAQWSAPTKYFHLFWKKMCANQVQSL